ncbi:hypothetical protein ABNavy4_124 [Acinetobacter phage AB-Navy4]|nr:hypothetical protein ABNavy4_124 [Acinetobacter phage AB-Navy4]
MDSSRPSSHRAIRKITTNRRKYFSINVYAYYTLWYNRHIKSNTSLSKILWLQLLSTKEFIVEMNFMVRSN